MSSEESERRECVGSESGRKKGVSGAQKRCVGSEEACREQKKRGCVGSDVSKVWEDGRVKRVCPDECPEDLGPRETGNWRCWWIWEFGGRNK